MKGGEDRAKLIEVQAETYRQMHEIARERGYPSILEALEATPAPPSLSPGVGCELPIVAKLRKRAAWQRENLGDMLDYGTPNPELEQAAKVIEELVEALDGFVEARDRYLESDCDSHAEHMAANRLDEAHEAARAALARAKGDRA